ncbi:hypothetical protein [Cohnella luojiensis]|uniref:DUF3888 domain-containing protein n=1 Tax=Cohnella luojiensis TaxID=652876 RepID=A0A4Y8LS66_9BACL|nr:hypothetical protein [Cohnella luojiensis]TFE23049.1 hypothetical protein E2980_20025 [Cohnella luojiensis]
MKKLQRRVSTFLIVVLSFVFLIAPVASISVAASTAADAEVFPYTQGTKYQTSTNYTLKANGAAVPVIRAFNDYDYAHFSASEGLITYELTILNTDKVHEYSISPKKH